MINEFQGTHKRVFKVDPTRADGLEVTADISAHEVYASYNSPKLSKSNTGPTRFRWRKWVEHVMLPAGFPNSTTPDLVEVAKWDALQTVCSSIVSTLAIRAVLIGVGVGASTASAIGSTASWMLRDGVLMISSIIFSTRVSSNLDCRAKTWRLIADISNDIALLIELFSAWFSRPIFLLLVATASVLKALVSVAGEGTRQALLQHFAKKGNSADVDAKARNRSNISALLGLLLGNIVSYMTPPSSWSTTLKVFITFTIVHLLANYMSVRSMILTHLNAPLLEWCLARFYEHEMELERMVKKTDTKLPSVLNPINNEGEKLSPSHLNISPELANKEENLFILPQTDVLSKTLGSNSPCTFRRFLCGRLHFLSVRIYFGASFYKILHNNANLSVSAKHEIVQKVSESLSVCGVALLFDESRQTYYVLLPEIFTMNGQPTSWVSVAKQFSLSLTSDKESESLSISNRDNGIQSAPNLYKNEALPEVVFETIPRRFLWAYFYAYSHTRAMTLHRQGGGETSSEGDEEPKRDEKGVACESAILGRQDDSTLHVIQSLRADGVLDLRRQCCRLPSEVQRSADDKEATPDQESDDDQLYPLYLRFISELQRNGWNIDRLLVPQQSHTIAIHYL
ncbi:unnamed protein product [Phytomonas sp. EM1]|nr:unnamed protein product [Phytomonas sp. EM1]|eukprot:CCW62929.1 unnamed protein product [Phytomonas sp. isolate EM1]